MSDKNEKGKTKKVVEWLMDALLSLMEEKPFREIKITEITQQAQLARCTFYRHFDSKEELLNACCQTLFEKLSKRMQMEDCNTFYGQSLGYFSFWLEHREFLELLMKSDMLYFLMQNHDLFMLRVAKEIKPENADKSPFEFSPKVRYHYFFGMWGFWGIAYRWISNGCKQSPEELAQYVVAYFVESYELEPGCQYYDKHKKYPFNPCYIKPGNEF